MGLGSWPSEWYAKKELLNRFAAKLAWLGDTASCIVFGGKTKITQYNTTERGKPGKVYSALTMNNKTTGTNISLRYWVSFA